MKTARANEIIETTAKTIADYAMEAGIMRQALEEIETGLANTRSTPGEWMTQIKKSDAWRIAFNALAEIDCRRAVTKAVAAKADNDHCRRVFLENLDPL